MVQPTKPFPEPPPLAKHRPKYVLECAEVLTDQAKANLRKSLDGLFALGEVIVLDKGVKIRPIDGKTQDELKALGHRSGAYERGWLMADEAPASNGDPLVPPSAPRNKTTMGGRVPQCTTIVAGARCPNVALVDAMDWPRKYCLNHAAHWADALPTAAQRRAFWPTQTWKLALATAAVWVAAIVTEIGPWN
jgi:hypothetical protein